MDPDLAIERFRKREGTEQKEDQLSRVFTDEGSQARRALYADSDQLRKPFDVARVERNHLRKALDTYKKSIKKKTSQEALEFLESCEDFQTLNQSLVDVRQQWAEKRRLFGGKGQDVFHKLCRTMGGHKTILDMFPDSNEYVSIFCAAFNTVVQASLNHQKTAERLLVDLEQINEAIEMAAGSVALFDIEATRVKFANLYGHVFHFFVEAMDWYGASSTVKIYRSLNSNYNDKFESVVGTIITIKSNIADRSSLGSMAEIRDIHLKVQLTSEDVVAMRRVLQEHKIGAEGQARELAERDAQNFELRQEVATYQRQIVELSNAVTRRQISEGMGRILESMIQQNPNGTLGLALPTIPIKTIAAAHASDQPGNIDPVQGLYDRDTLILRTESFRDHIYGQGSAESLLDTSQAVALPNAMFGRLRDWISSDASEMLWIAGPTDHRYPSKMSAIAATIIRLFAEAEPMVVFHFCDLPRDGELEDGITSEEVGVVSLVYSVIQQLVCHVRPEFESAVDFSEQRFAALNGNIERLANALTLLKDLVPLCLPYIVFVIDGLERLDYSKGRDGCEDLVTVLRELTIGENGAADSNGIYKVLFTTSGTSATLMRELEVGEVLLQDGRRGSLHIDRHALGKTAIADLEFR